MTPAQRAFEELRVWSAGKRRDHLEKLYALVEREQKRFADLIVQEAGKPVAFAEAEVSRALGVLKAASAESLRFSGEVVPVDDGIGEGKVAS